MRSLLLLLLVGCGTDSVSTDTAFADTSRCEEDYDLNWDNFGHGFFLTYCTSCHSSTSPNRFDAPEGIDFDTEEQARAWKDVLGTVVVEEQTMPLGGGVYDEDLYLFEIYLECGL